MALFEDSGNSCEPEILQESHTSNQLEARIVYRIDNPCFDGHFDNFPIVPGVVQIDWIMRCSYRYWGLDSYLHTIKRVKFMKPIVPDQIIILKMTLCEDRSKIEYQMNAESDDAPLSGGKLQLSQLGASHV